MKYKLRPKAFERSGYFPTKDMMEHYRVPIEKESEYHRKLRQSIERDELSGPDAFRESNPNYRIQEIKEDRESPRDWEKFRESILHDAIEQFKKQNNVDKVSEDKYEIAQDTAQEITEKLTEIQSNDHYNPNVVEVTEQFLSKPEVVEDNQSDLSLINDARQTIIDEKMKEVDSLETLEQVEDKMGEIRGINDTFFDYIDSYEVLGKRRDLYSDSEVNI